MKITIISDNEYYSNTISLAKALRKKKIDAELILPLQKRNSCNNNLESLGSFSITLPFGNVKIDAYSCIINDVPCFLISGKHFHPAENIYYEDAEATSVFCHGAIELLKYLKSYPDQIFTDSPRTALIPVLLRIKYRYHTELAAIRTYHYINSNSFCVYNRAFAASVFGIDEDSSHILMTSKEINMTKAAILCASRIFVGEGGISILYDRSSSVHHAAVQFGFKIRKLNMGIDYESFDTDTDTDIHRNYNTNTISERKQNKMILQRHFRFKQDDSVPMIAVYANQNREMVSLLVKNLCKRELHIILLCRENESYRGLIPPLYAENIREITYDLCKLKKIFSGSDLSVFSDISSIYGNLAYISAAYGCVPVIPSQKYFDIGLSYFNKITLDGNGFTYDKNIKEDIIYTLWDALGIYRNDKKTFAKLIHNTMKKDFSVDIAAETIPHETEKSPYFNY